MHTVGKVWGGDTGTEGRRTGRGTGLVKHRVGNSLFGFSCELLVF